MYCGGVLGPGAHAGLCAARLLTSRAGRYAGPSGELFRFSTVSMEWTMLDAAAGVTGTSPGARYSHAMTAVGTDIYLNGGYGDSGKGCDRWMGRGQTEELAQ